MSRQVAHRWKSAWEKGGRLAGSKGKAGRKSKLTAEQTDVVVKALVAGPVSRGYKTNLWTLPRVAALIKGPDRGRVPSRPCLASVGRQRVQLPTPGRRAIERDEPKIRRWKRVEWPAIKKPAKRAGTSSSSTKAD